MATISQIVAITRDGAIGRGGDLIYHISGDLRRFKAVTMGHPVIMGRKTYESLPSGALPGRRNMVVSRNSSYTAPDAEVFESVEAAIAALDNDDEAFIIGGGQLYAATLPLASKLYLTVIDADAPADADTFFPAIDSADWHTIESSEDHTDPRSGVAYRFICLSRN